MLAPLMQTDPSTPRLTVYDDSRGVRTVSYTHLTLPTNREV